MATKIANALSSKKFSLNDVPDLTGKVGFLSGGTEGIGHATAHTLLSKNISKLIIVTRWSPDSERVQNAVDDFKSSIASVKEDPAKIVWKTCDLGDLKAVQSLGNSLRDTEKRLDILINNASIGIDNFRKHECGIDSHMMVNYFGPVLLTSILLPLLRKTSKETGSAARVVTVSSNLHSSASSSIQFKDVDEMNTDLGPNGLYARAKLAELIWTRYVVQHQKEASAKEGKVFFNAVHPGVIRTEQQDAAAKAYGPIGQLALPLLKPLLSDIFDGCLSTLYAATSPEIEMEDINGEYIETPATVMEPSKQAQDQELAANLISLTKSVWNQVADITDVSLY